MAKIYVSPETLKKLSKKGGYNEVLNHFDVNRPEPKRHCKTSKTEKSLNTNKRQSKVKKPKQSKSSNRIKYVTLNILKHPSKKSKRIGPQQKVLMGDIPKRKRSKISSRPVTFFYTLRKNSSKSNSNKSSGKKTPVSSKYMFDYSSPVSEYESRQVEFGHGRAKSKEWNDEIARKFQKELKGYHRKKDWTDRFALK